jgi:hypothetical protein
MTYIHRELNPAGFSLLKQSLIRLREFNLVLSGTLSEAVFAYCGDFVARASPSVVDVIPIPFVTVVVSRLFQGDFPVTVDVGRFVPKIYLFSLSSSRECPERYQDRQSRK